jgi:hypothetical protein
MEGKNSWVHRNATGLFLFAALLFIRLPFFFRDYMDHDESTFILMGQSVADGRLPYDHLWDLKPPLLFYLFGLIEWLFPYSLLAVRVFGFLVIFFSSLVLLHIGRETRLRNPILIALSYVIFSSLFGSVQGVMSEHLSVFFMLAGLWLLLKNKFLFAGFLFGCAVMCKMNYAYAIPAIMVFYLLKGKLNLPLVKKLMLLVAGVVVSFFLIALPFIIQGKFELFTDSVFLAPFEYGQASSIGMMQKLKKTWWIILSGLIIAGLGLKKSQAAHREVTALSALILLMTIYTFYSSGTVNGHYLIQAYPFMAIIILGVLVRPLRIRMQYLAILVLLVSVESWLEYARVARHITSVGTAYNGKSFQVIRELKDRHIENKSIFFADYHISYWFLHRYPLTKSSTHPSSLKRPFLFRYFGNSNKTSMDELSHILETIKPELIVSKNRHLSFFGEGSEENNYFKSVTDSSYRMIIADDRNRIYTWERIPGR